MHFSFLLEVLSQRPRKRLQRQPCRRRWL